MHVPPSRKHLLGLRPDLDAKHERYVRKVVAKEKRAEARILSRRIKFRHDTREALMRRRAENQEREERVMNPEWNQRQGLQQQERQQRASAYLDTRTRDGMVKKDWRFYRRQGAVWTDLIHTAPDRLHLVLRPKIVEMDIAATKYIKGRYEEEREQERLVAAQRKSRASEIRKEFQENIRQRHDLSVRCGGDPPSERERRKSVSRDGNSKKRMQRPSTATARFVGSARLMQLARPKDDPVLEESKVQSIPDFRGLLAVDHTIGPIVRSMTATHGQRQEQVQEQRRRQNRRTRPHTARQAGTMGTEYHQGADFADRAHSQQPLRPSTAPMTWSMMTGKPAKDVEEERSRRHSRLSKRANRAWKSSSAAADSPGPRTGSQRRVRSGRNSRPSTAHAIVQRPISSRSNYWKFVDEAKAHEEEEEQLPLYPDDRNARAKQAYAQSIDEANLR